MVSNKLLTNFTLTSLFSSSRHCTNRYCPIHNWKNIFKLSGLYLYCCAFFLICLYQKYRLCSSHYLPSALFSWTIRSWLLAETVSRQWIRNTLPAIKFRLLHISHFVFKQSTNIPLLTWKKQITHLNKGHSDDNKYCLKNKQPFKSDINKK